jgi:phage tail sheath gpL-like
MPTGIGFNEIPGSGLIAPGVFFEVNSGGQFSSVRRLILVGYKTSTGILAVETPTPVTSLAQADKLAGPGSMLREMWRVAAKNAPAQPIWMVAIADPGTPKAVWTLAVNSVPATGQGIIEICGRRIRIPVVAADTADTVAAKINAAINAYYDTLTGAMLPVTSTVLLDEVTITARHAGVAPAGIDGDSPLLIEVPVSYDLADNVLSGAVTTLTQTVLGTGSPDISGALAAIGDNPADFLACPFHDSGTLTALQDFYDARWLWDRMVWGGAYVPYSADTASIVAFAGAMDTGRIAVLPRFVKSRIPEWEMVSGVVARVAPWLSDVVTGNVSRNQTGLRIEGVYGPRGVTGDPFGYNGRNTILAAGASSFRIDSDGTLLIDKIITTQKTGEGGQPDVVFRPINTGYQVSGGIDYLRAVLLQTYTQKALAAENPGNLAAIATPSEIKATLIAAHNDLVLRGVWQDNDTFARTIVVAVNSENPSRVDVAMHIRVVNQLDIIAVNATFYLQYPSGLAAAA